MKSKATGEAKGDRADKATNEGLSIVVPKTNLSGTRNFANRSWLGSFPVNRQRESFDVSRTNVPTPMRWWSRFFGRAALKPETRVASNSVALRAFPPPGVSLRSTTHSAWGDEVNDVTLLDRLVASNPGHSASIALEVHGPRGRPSELGQGHSDKELMGGALPSRVQMSVTAGYSCVCGGANTPVGHAQEEIDWLSGTVVGLKAFWAPIGTAGGTRATLDRYSLYRDLGLRRVVGVAGAAHGGYVWARFGFRTGPKGVSTIRSAASRALDRLVDQGLMAPADADGARRVLDEGGADLAFRVSTLAGNVDGQPLGQALLKGVRWLGVFDLHDPVSWEKAKTFAYRR